MRLYPSLFLLFAMTAVGCTNLFPLPPVTAVLGQPVALKIGQSAQFDDGLVIAFQDVSSDERCSSCTASYSAHVELRLTAPGKTPLAVGLTTPPIPKIDGDTSPYTIQFVNLEPQPQYPHLTVNRADYKLTLKVSK